MSDVEAALRQAAQPHLRSTEQINGCGAMSRVVPIAGLLIPFTRRTRGQRRWQSRAARRKQSIPPVLSIQWA